MPFELAQTHKCVSHTLFIYCSFRIRDLEDGNLKTDYSLWQVVCNFSPESSFVLNGSHLLESEYAGCLVQLRSEAETLQPIRVCGGSHTWGNQGIYPLAVSPLLVHQSASGVSFGTEVPDIVGFVTLSAILHRPYKKGNDFQLGMWVGGSLKHKQKTGETMEYKRN